MSAGTVQRRLFQIVPDSIFSSGEEEDVQPVSQDHCCAPTSDTLPGCDANEQVINADNTRIGLLNAARPGGPRPLFTKKKVVVENYFREFRVYCRMDRLKRQSERGSPETNANWSGAEKWRWLLFAALYFPLSPVSHAIAGVFSYFVTVFSIGGRNVRLSTLAAVL